MQASYMIGSGTTMQEIQPAVQIAARHNIFPQMAPYPGKWQALIVIPGEGTDENITCISFYPLLPSLD